MSILVVESRFHENVADVSLSSVFKALESKAMSCDVFSTHNVFEIPMAINMKLEFSDYAGVIALGCVIQKESDNAGCLAIYQECLRGINEIGVYYSIPVGLGVFVAKSVEQAELLAKNSAKNAALSCLKMLKIRDQFNFTGDEHSLKYNN